MSLLKHSLKALLCLTALISLAPAPAFAGTAWASINNMTDVRAIYCSSPYCGFSTATQACTSRGYLSTDYAGDTMNGLGMDLNKNAGGDYIYLCELSRAYPYPGAMVSNISAMTSFLGDTDYCSDYGLTWVKHPVSPPYVWYFSNLNQGVSNLAEDMVYLCIHHDENFFTDSIITHIAAGSSDSSLSDAKSECKRGMNNAGISSSEVNYVVARRTQEAADMNNSVGGDWIVLCTRSKPFVPAECPGNAVQFRGQNGRQLSCQCSTWSALTIWGTDTYTDDSPLCTAAHHAGRIGASGIINFEITAGSSQYYGSTRNNVTSSSYGSWSGSYKFID